MNQQLKSAMNKIQKSTPNLIRNAQEQGKTKKITLDSPNMNYVFGGQFPIGRQYNLFGPFSGGKTSLCNYLAGQLQTKVPVLLNKPDKNVVIFADFERSFDIDFATQNGLKVDEEHLIFMKPDSIEDFVDAACDLVQTGSIAGIIWDSEAASPTRTQMAAEAGKQAFGPQAKAITEALRKLNILCDNYDTTMFIISQERAQMNVNSHAIQQTGGYALGYFCSVRARVTKVETIERGDETIGIHMKIRNYKNKCGTPFRTCECDLYYNGGFDADAEYFDFFLRLGLVTQKGAWFYLYKGTDEEKGFQGRAKAEAWFKENPDKFVEFKNKANKMIDSITELDADNEDPEAGLEEPKNDEEYAEQLVEFFEEELTEEGE